MWNWLVSSLASGATIILYDGAPTFPDIGRMWELIDDQKITHFGTSPKYLGAVNKAGYSPRKNNQLSSLKAILSTGSPLPGNLFSWIYEEVAYVPVMSIAGGTDLAGCFMGGNPNLPVYSAAKSFPGPPLYVCTAASAVGRTNTLPKRPDAHWLTAESGKKGILSWRHISHNFEMNNLALGAWARGPARSPQKVVG